jgi:hypothetical protein
MKPTAASGDTSLRESERSMQGIGSVSANISEAVVVAAISVMTVLVIAGIRACVRRLRDRSGKAKN